MWKKIQHFNLQYYLLSIVLTTVITLTKLQLPVIGLETPFLLFIFVVIFTAYLGGFGPGLMALVATSFSAAYFFLAPTRSLQISAGIIQMQLVVYIFESLISITILAALRNLRIQLAESNKNLEEKVANRTKELRTTMKEITKVNEELKRSNKELEEFAYIASHDLQEPLRKIQSFGNLLHDEYRGKINEEGQLYIDRMLNASARMRNLIDDLLSYSRVTTNRIEFNTVSLNTIMAELLNTLDIQIQDVNADISVKTLPDVIGDENQLYQLFQNLISNALRYRSDKRKPKIQIWSEKEGSMSRIYVKDNGIGFDEKYKDRIFNIFERLHGRHKYEGTGIGLAIVKKIIQRHKGEVDVKSKIDRGTTFIISLPIPNREKYDK